MTGSTPRPPRPSGWPPLRGELAQRGLDGFVVPRADEHQGEYVPRRSQRLGWLNRLRRFGRPWPSCWPIAPRSSSTAAIRWRCAARSTWRPSRRTRCRRSRPNHGSRQTCPRAASWASIPGCRHSTATSASSLRAARRRQPRPPLSRIPIDAVWRDPPPPRRSRRCCRIPRNSPAKAARRAASAIAEIVASKGADVALLTAPDSIAWLLNVRGGDVPRTAIRPLGFALLHSDGHVESVHGPPQDPRPDAAWLGNSVTPGTARRARLCARHAGQDVQARADRNGERALLGGDPAAGGRRHTGARLRSGLAAQGLQESRRAGRHPRRPSPRWRGRQPIPGVAPAPNRRAASCAKSKFPTACKKCAKRPASCAILSFDTISGAGPNGAIVHYRASEATERTLERARSISSTRAVSIATARPTSPAPSASERRRRR